MIIRINDDDGEALQEYRFDPRKFITSEAIEAEKATGLFWAHIMVGLDNGSAQAVAAVVWLLRRRDEPKLKFGDVIFNVGMTEVFDPDTDPRYADGPDEDGFEDDGEDDGERPTENVEAPKAGVGESSNTPD
jgi:hypothetical protein